MTAKSGSPKTTEPPAELRGVIDSLEDEVASVVFDDDQRLDWPRRYLPQDAKAGDAVIVRAGTPGEARWRGKADRSKRITLAPAQSLKWPASLKAGEVSLSIEVDAGDTAARKDRVRGLIDDLFSKNSAN
jgi:hypothetical protein